jgi:uncharacterized protein YjbI with pentapeptide repeats
MAEPVSPEENLAGRDLRRAALREADLAGRDLHDANLTGADLRGLRAPRANLAGARLRRCQLGEADLSEASLVGADLTDADLTAADLTAADLDRALLDHATLEGATLERAKLAQLTLRRVDLRRASLRGCDLFGACLADSELAGADLSQGRLVEADLSYADLSGAVLRDADLSRADLSGANLDRADLSGATVAGARLSWVQGLPVGARRELQARGAQVPVWPLSNAWAKLNLSVRRHAAASYLGSLLVITALAALLAIWIARQTAQTQTYPLHPPESGLIYEVDCGSASDLAYRGRQGFVGGTPARARPVSIQRVALAPVDAYLTERSGPEFRYQFRLGRGWYEVQLHFVELQHSHRGDRIFDIKLEGKMVARDFDILAETYPRTVLVKRYAVWVDDGMLNLQFLTRIGRAKVDLIRVRRMDISPEWVRQRGDP